MNIQHVKQINENSEPTIWVPSSDETDVDNTIHYEDVNHIDTSVSIYHSDVAAKLDIEGFGGGGANAGKALMLYDFVATRAKKDKETGLGKKYGFGVRCLISIAQEHADAHSNITGFVADAHADKFEANVKFTVIGLSSGQLSIPAPSKLSIDTYALIIELKTQVEGLLSRRDDGVKLNPTCMFKEIKSDKPFDDLELLRDSYRLLAAKCISKELSRAEAIKWIESVEKILPLKNKHLFERTVEEIYDQFKVSKDTKPNASQILSVLEKTDGISARREGYK